MTNQSDLQQSIRNITGTSLNYEGDWHALFDAASIPVGAFNGRLLQWINAQLSTSYTEINGAMAAYAESQGVVNWNSLNGVGGVPFEALPLAPVSTDNAIFFADTGATTRFDRNLDLPAGDWCIGIHIKVPTNVNASNVIFNASTSSSNPYSTASSAHLHYRAADGQISFQALDASSVPFGQSSPPLPAANTNVNALISTHPLYKGQSCLIGIQKVGNLAQMWLMFDGQAPIKTAEAYTTMGAITNPMLLGVGRDSSNPSKLQMRNFFKVSYALTEAQWAQVANGTDPTTLGTPNANDFRFLLDANTNPITSTINGLTASRTFNNATIVTGVGLAPQTEAVFMTPLGGSGWTIQESGGSATFNISGRYLGADGGDIECRFIDQNGTAFTAPVIVASSISGGTWTGSVTVPRGQRWVRAQLRKIISGTPSANVMTTSVNFGVGQVVMLSGQSLQEHMGYPNVITTYTGNISGISKYGSSDVTPNGFTSFTVDKAPQVTAVSRKQISVTGMANNGSGLIRVTFSGRHGQRTGQQMYILGTVGTTEANGLWTVTVVSTTQLDLDGSTFTNAWVSGGTGYIWNNCVLMHDNTMQAMPDGHVLIANAISNLTNSVVCISNQAVGGQAINQFNSFTTAGGVNNYGTTALLAAKSLGGIGHFLWLHGHQNIGQTSYFMDSGTWGSEVGYGELGTLYEFMKTNLPSTAFKFGLAGFTNIQGQSSATSANIHEFRHAFKRWVDRKAVDGDTNPFFTGWYNDLDVQWENGATQNAHLPPTLKGYQSQAARQGHATAQKILSTTNLAVGPSITSATRSGATIDLTIAQTGGSDIEWSRIGDGAIPNGFEVSTSTGFGSLLTISNITRINATTLRITLSADPAATCYVRYQYGRCGTYATGIYGTIRITGVADNGAGLIRVTTAVNVSPATPTASQRNNTGHGLTTGDWINIPDVAGAIQANGVWQVTVISATQFDLIGSSSVGLGTFTANSNLFQASATGAISVETGIPIYDNQTIAGWDTNGLPLQPTYTFITA